jgi:ABC-type oligopeptide transport system substrate-binding subunit
MKKLLALLVALLMVFTVVACGEKPATTTEPAPEATAAPAPKVVDPADIANQSEFDVMTLGKYEYGKDYTSLYEKYGKDITIADVTEDPETGFGYITVDGEQKLLGLDFLTMAMVYNDTPAGDYKTEDDVYAAWWRLYITRWNYLLPEVPLYSNEYYDLYNAQIKGVEEHPTNPFWNPARALVDWSSEKADDSIILGSSTELSGQFRVPSFGKSSPGASDNDIGYLTTGLDTVVTTKEGGFAWNDIVVAEHDEKLNDDGTLTYTIKIKDDLKFSDGSPITAKDYVAFTLASLSPVYTEAASRETSGLTIKGWKDEYQLYKGPEYDKGTKELSGIRLLDDYTFSVTIVADYANYFYKISYASFSASPAAAWLGEGVEIKDDGNGCYLSDAFYAVTGSEPAAEEPAAEEPAAEEPAAEEPAAEEPAAEEPAAEEPAAEEPAAEEPAAPEATVPYESKSFAQAAKIKKLCTDTSEENYAAYPWSGAYVVKSFDKTDSTATLVKNEYYKGNYDGAVPHIGTIIYKKIVAATQLEDFKAGGLDVIAAITGGSETDEALKLADESNGKYVYTHYSRAGYGKLGFRADYGPAQFASVRQAIALCMDRAQFAKDFTGGYGGVVDGPYYKGSWMYKAAVEQGMMLDGYATSADSAIAVLEADGWVWNADGTEYAGTGIRYKAIPADKINDNDKAYKSVDGKYKTELVNGVYLMPLVINWYGTTPNEFTDLLQTGFRTNANVEKVGMAVYNTLGDFAPMLDELYQQAAYGYYSGTPMYCAFNFATGFNSAAYDFAFNMTIDPAMYDDYSQYYIKDFADILWLK